jgi:hypothetical protein
MQVARVGGRKYFDGARKKLFLEWFLATANIGFAAEQAGVCRQTVSKHRLSDPEFEEQYLRALRLAVPDLQARLLSFLNGRPKLDLNGELEPPDDADFDPQLALQILREQQRILERAARGKALKPGRAPRVASNAEVEAALAKRLAVYSARLRSKAAPPVQGEEQ